MNDKNKNINLTTGNLSAVQTMYSIYKPFNLITVYSVR